MQKNHLMAKRKPLLVYKASAGSGKTFTLALEYIKLLMLDPQSFRSVLAVTFTNKATEEMTVRIMSRLYGMARRLDDSRSYINILTAELGMTEDEVCRQAGKALHALLHNFHYFRVETIDSFFQRVLRNLARELGLTANLRVELNDKEVEQQAVDRIVESLEEKDEVLDWLMTYIIENIDEDKNWNVIRQIKKFGENIFKEHYKKYGKELKEINAGNTFDAYRKELRALMKTSLDAMKRHADRFFDDLEQRSLTVADLAYGPSGPAGYFVKLRNNIIDGSVMGKRVEEAVGDPSKWFTKKSPYNTESNLAAAAGWSEMISLIEKERSGRYKQYQSAKVTLQYFNRLRLLEKIDEMVSTINGETNRFLLNNTPDLLHEFIGTSDTPFVYEKFGTQLNHVMIDEFQDTSTIQWDNFKTLLLENMSRGHLNLLVGDVKQSIYRWRSGDWRLLNNIREVMGMPDEMIDINTLDTNYRSDKRVIEFNNAFFEQAALQETDEMEKKFGTRDPQLEKAYADVRQNVPAGKPDEGFVDIRLFDASVYKDAATESLLEVLDRLLNEQGAEPNDIAILVRSNADLPVIAEAVMQAFPDVQIVSDEAFRLDASSAVNIIVLVMRSLVHPDDRLTQATLAVMYQREVVRSGATIEDILIGRTNYDAFLPEEFVAHRHELTAMPVYEMVQFVLRVFGLDGVAGQDAYLCAFNDILSDFLYDKPVGIEAFLQEWDERLASKSIQGDVVDGIRLMTIHKSKGLEFKHVIIPYCDWDFVHREQMIWCVPSQEPFNKLPIVPLNYSEKQLKGTIYENDLREEYLQIKVDNLNLLYVAFTRAEESLTVFGRLGAAESRSRLVETCIGNIVGSLPGAVIEEEEQDGTIQALLFTYGKPEVAAGADKSPSEPELPSDPNVFSRRPEEKVVRIEAFDPVTEFRQSNLSRRFVEGEDDDTEQSRYIKLGSILHYVLLQIRYADEADAVMARLEDEGILRRQDVSADRVRGLLRKRLAGKHGQEWFSRDWKVLNECSILSHDEDGTHVVEHRPDRVIFRDGQTVVIDFKFGSPKEEYRSQVRNYIRLLSDMGDTPVKGYLWYVYTDEVEEVMP